MSSSASSRGTTLTPASGRLPPLPLTLPPIHAKSNSVNGSRSVSDVSSSKYHSTSDSDDFLPTQRTIRSTGEELRASNHSHSLSISNNSLHTAYMMNEDGTSRALSLPGTSHNSRVSLNSHASKYVKNETGGDPSVTPRSMNNLRIDGSVDANSVHSGVSFGQIEDPLTNNGGGLQRTFSSPDARPLSRIESVAFGLAHNAPAPIRDPGSNMFDGAMKPALSESLHAAGKHMGRVFACACLATAAVGLVVLPLSLLRYGVWKTKFSNKLIVSWGVVLANVVTVLCLLLGYPTALTISFFGSSRVFALLPTQELVSATLFAVFFEFLRLLLNAIVGVRPFAAELLASGPMLALFVILYWLGHNLSMEINSQFFQRVVLFPALLSGLALLSDSWLYTAYLEFGSSVERRAVFVVVFREPLMQIVQVSIRGVLRRFRLPPRSRDQQFMVQIVLLPFLIVNNIVSCILLLSINSPWGAAVAALCLYGLRLVSAVCARRIDLHVYRWCRYLYLRVTAAQVINGRWDTAWETICQRSDEFFQESAHKRMSIGFMNVDVAVGFAAPLIAPMLVGLFWPHRSWYDFGYNVNSSGELEFVDYYVLFEVILISMVCVAVIAGVRYTIALQRNLKVLASQKDLGVTVPMLLVCCVIFTFVSIRMFARIQELRL